MMHINGIRIERRRIRKLEKKERLDRKGVRIKDREETETISEAGSQKY
jgi:hypothetical protein